MLKTFVCKYVVQYNNNLQKKHVWNNNKNVVQEDEHFTEIFVKKTDAEFAVSTWSSSKYGSISMAKYWHAV